jgi:AcrR family transcriptional regulator
LKALANRPPAHAEIEYGAATFGGIAARADLTRTAVNYYFPSKAALYRAVLDDTNALVVKSEAKTAAAETTLLGNSWSSSTTPQGDFETVGRQRLFCARRHVG